jgi:succinyl-diaminopimelate desuccinylase
MSTKDQSDRITAYLKDSRDDLLDFTCRLVSTSSMNPPGDERAVVTLIQKQMEKLGLTGSQLVSKTPERPNLVYTQKGSTGKPRLLFNGHTDTKPVGAEDSTQWHTPPRSQPGKMAGCMDWARRI